LVQATVANCSFGAIAFIFGKTCILKLAARRRESPPKIFEGVCSLALFDHYFLVGNYQSDLARYFGQHRHGGQIVT
jgi:hypothetical protein